MIEKQLWIFLKMGHFFLTLLPESVHAFYQFLSCNAITQGTSIICFFFVFFQRGVPIRICFVFCLSMRPVPPPSKFHWVLFLWSRCCMSNRLGHHLDIKVVLSKLDNFPQIDADVNSGLVQKRNVFPTRSCPSRHWNHPRFRRWSLPVNSFSETNVLIDSMR